MNETKEHGLSGILNVDKPPGLTSHDVVAAVRKMARQRRVGHAGTLDPLATGVLLVCLGQATRVSEYLVRSRKAYRALIRLGVSTTTHDAEGAITGEAEVRVTRAQVEAALQRLVGHIRQIPPKYSAIRLDGRRLYDLARQGIDVEVPARWVDVYQIEVVEWTPPQVCVDVRCGPGTYVRALARDLGAALGCGAHLAALRRLSSGSFTVSEALSIEQLGERFAAGTVAQVLHPLDAAFGALPALGLSDEQARCVAMGQPVAVVAEMGTAVLARAYGAGGQFVALVYRDEHTGAWRPRKVFLRPEEIMPIQPLDVQHARADE